MVKFLWVSSHKFQPGLILNKQASGLDYYKKSELIWMFVFVMILDLSAKKTKTSTNNPKLFLVPPRPLKCVDEKKRANHLSYQETASYNICNNNNNNNKNTRI